MHAVVLTHFLLKSKTFYKSKVYKVYKEVFLSVCDDIITFSFVEGYLGLSHLLLFVSNAIWLQPNTQLLLPVRLGGITLHPTETEPTANKLAILRVELVWQHA